MGLEPVSSMICAIYSTLRLGKNTLEGSTITTKGCRALVINLKKVRLETDTKGQITKIPVTSNELLTAPVGSTKK